MNTPTRLFLILLSLSIFSCGGEKSSDSVKTGALTFGIKWVLPGQQKPADVVGDALYAMNCTTLGVSTISVDVKNSSGSSVASGGPWGCSAGSGTISAVPVGSNYTVAVTGKNSGGTITYSGQRAGVSITAGVTNDAGTIAVAYVGAGTGTGSSASSPLVGTWKMMTSQASSAVSPSNMSSYNYVVVFTSDGTWTMSSPASASRAGCLTTATFTSTSTTFTSIYVTDSCSTTSLEGTTEIISYTISGATLTTVSNKATTTWQKQGASTGATAPYTNNGNGTITQNAAGLLWQQQDDSVMRSWDEATTYCAGLVLGGYTGWRLPTKDELLGMVDTSQVPTVNAAYFANTHSSYYWSSSINPDFTIYAWDVNFSNGAAYTSSKTYNFVYVRCVRLG